MKTSLLSNSINEPKRSRSSLLFFAAFAAFALFGCFAFAVHKSTPESLESSVGVFWNRRSKDEIIIGKGQFSEMRTWPILRLQAKYPEHKYEYANMPESDGNDILYRILVHNELKFVEFLDPSIKVELHQDWAKMEEYAKDIAYSRWKMRKFAMEEVLNDDVERGKDVDTETKSSNCVACIRKWDEITNNYYAANPELNLQQEQIKLIGIITAYLSRAKQDYDDGFRRHEQRVRVIQMSEEELDNLGFPDGRTLNIFIEPPLRKNRLTAEQKRELEAAAKFQRTLAHNEFMRNNPHREGRNKYSGAGHLSDLHGGRNQGTAFRPSDKENSSNRVPTAGTGKSKQQNRPRSETFRTGVRSRPGPPGNEARTRSGPTEARTRSGPTEAQTRSGPTEARSRSGPPGTRTGLRKGGNKETPKL